MWRIQASADVKHLRKLTVEGCHAVRDFSFLARSAYLSELRIRETTHLTNLEAISGLASLAILELSQCPNLTDLSPINGMISLSDFSLIGCSRIKDISVLQNLKNLQRLSIHECHNITDLSPLSNISTLEQIRLSGRVAERVHIPESLLPKVVRVHHHYGHRRIYSIRDEAMRRHQYIFYESTYAPMVDITSPL
jgi:hypothetical protein